ncbi:MAG: TldD/PmbA family protein [Deltaproteobacteria bacterium]|nr:TldD/PmbA family protein [Deltaproteobacteria bacterium]MBW2535681.1 TldD/PmbA family protein [Deltaproteobacteria bacterium]
MGAGTALCTVPAWLWGCAPQQALPPPKQKVPVPAPPGHTTYFDGFGLDQGALGRVIQKWLGRGGDFAEIFLQHKVIHWVGMEDGAVNRAYSTIDLGAGIRVLKGDATGFAYTEDLSEQALLTAAATAAAVADGSPSAPPKPLAAVKVDSSYALAVPWTAVGIDKKVPIVEQTDRIARARDKRIIKATVFLSDETSHILIANSAGLLVEDEQPMTVLSASCVAEQNGKTETSYQAAAGRAGLDFYSPERIQQVATEAADYTVMLFDAVPPPVGELPVVLATGITGILLHEAIGHGMEADFNRKGISIYADRIGKRIAAEQVTIVDDGTNQGLRGSINVDDEGTPTQQTVLVEKGILRSYLHDRISARHYDVPSTGNGRRQSFRYPPVPRMRNTYMMNGPHKPEEIIASVDKGLYAEKFMNGQVDIGAGDFTFYLKHGRLIEKGKLGPVVKDANLIGAGPKVLEHVDMVADDMELYSGAGYCGKDGQRIAVGFGLPTVRAGAISIGGRES